MAVNDEFRGEGLNTDWSNHGRRSAYLAALMKRCAGNLSQASREADVARHHLRDLLKKRGLYGLSWQDEKADD